VSCIACMGLFWGLWFTFIYPNPADDTVEQFNWSHSLEWGYHKHPPLPTWLLFAAIKLFGPHPYVAYGLAQLCIGITLWVVWRMCCELMPQREAFVALLLMSCIGYFTGRGHYLNHNTVLLPWVAMASWAFLRLTRAAGWRAWAVFGIATGFGILTKYQMLLYAGLYGVYLLWAGRKGKSVWIGAALSASIACAIILPHGVWLVRNDFQPFTYARGSLGASFGFADRVHVVYLLLTHQVTRLAPVGIAVLFAWLCILVRQWAGSAPVHADTSETDHERALRNLAPTNQSALAWLAWSPLVALTAVALLLGAKVHSHWATTAVLFVIPWVVFQTTRLPSRQIKKLYAKKPLTPPRIVFGWQLAVGVFAVHLLTAIWYLSDRDQTDTITQSRTLPAAALAQQILERWVQATGEREVPILAGSGEIAGALSLHLKNTPPVLIDGSFRTSPWITPAHIARRGAVLIWDPAQPIDTRPSKRVLALAGPHYTIQAPALHQGQMRMAKLTIAIILPTAPKT
jgi:4-amino-4-deoxy-L-arabinose transferase-like glycosyltransferase